jgi:sulfate-transporting ATPase
MAARLTLPIFRRRSSRDNEMPAQPSTPDRVVPKSLRIDNLRVTFGEVVAVKDVSLVVAPGLITGLIGPNGAGKTTVMDVTTGFSARESGSITLGGVSVDGWSPRRLARAGLGRSFQSLELFETLTVRDHVSIASDRLSWRDRIRDLFWPRRRPLSPAAIAALTELGLADQLHRRPEDLSHGHRRLLAIARAAAMQPSILLLDEPAAGLDEHESKELGALIRGLARKWGIGVLLVEHDLPLVMSVCDRITVINFGETIAEGTPEEIRASPGVIAAYLGETHDDVAADLLPARTTEERVTRAPSPTRSTTPILVAKSLSAGYGGVAAVRDVSLEVRPGEVVALLGPNGAGKTTTLLALAGALPMMHGEVSWKSGVTTKSVEWRARHGLTLVPEERSVFMDLTTAENLRIADGSEDLALELFPELIEVLNKKAGLLSGGQQQMLAVGRSIASKPEVLMADELSLGLAPLVVGRLLQAVRGAADAGAGVLLVEQHARAALDVADRAYVMQRGQVVLAGTADEIRDRLADIEDAYLSSGPACVALAGVTNLEKVNCDAGAVRA